MSETVENVSETVFSKPSFYIAVYALLVAGLFILANWVGGDFVMYFNAVMQITKWAIILLPLLAIIGLCEASNIIIPFLVAIVREVIRFFTAQAGAEWVLGDIPWHIDTDRIVNLVLTVADTLTPQLTS